MHSPPTSEPLSAVFVGEDSLLVTCGDVWLEAGHRIEAVISDIASIRTWAKERELRLISISEAFTLLGGEGRFDYLFSIVNNRLLPDEVLALAARAAINFHDGPLPRYGGINATNWAIMNGEPEHGITWHVMTDVVDGGPVVEQRRFPIRPDDTALTLNARCWEEALGAFREMTRRLGVGDFEPVEQDLACRTYVGRWQRPHAAATVEWGRPASEIDALLRGLDHGPYFNPLAKPKALIGDRLVVLSAVETHPDASSEEAGVVRTITEGSFTVAAAPGEVVVTGLETLEGQPLDLAATLAEAGVRPGDQLTCLAEATAARLTEESAKLARHERYWIDRLADLDIMAAPYADVRAAGGGTAQVAELNIPTVLVERVPDIREHVTAAFLLYLMRVDGRKTYDLGYRGDGQVVAEGCGDYFAAAVPLRAHYEDGGSVVGFVDGVTKELRHLEKRRTYARDLLARAPELEDLPVAPSFPVVLELLTDTAGAPVSDAALTVRISEDGLLSRWFFDPVALSAEDVDRMHQQFLALLGSLVDDQPELDDLRILPASDLETLERWNETGRQYNLDTTLHYLFEEQVARTPEAPALSFAHEQLTYGELNRRANQLAHFLRQRGVTRETRVGVSAERSLEMVVALYGILKAGGAYVPMDPEYPAERLAFMMEDARVPILLTQSHLLDRFPDHGGAVICLDRDWDQIARGREENPAHINQPDDLAYLIYTSGSTGKPKGAMNEHKGIVNRLLWMQEAFPLEDDDRVLQKTPFSFDVSVWEFFWPLQVGAQLAVARPGGHKDGAYLVRTIRDEAITTVHFVPSMLQLFVEEPDLESCTSLRRVICSGEALPKELQDQWFARVDTELHNLYGPTEAAVDVSWWSCDRDSPLDFVPIGKPIANTQLHVLDPKLRPVPIGVVGELHIGGVQVARGYLNRPELNAEKFIPDPFSSTPGARLYRTGDLARFISGGDIEYLGRIDHQVKLRGLRIELGEIEALLAQHPAVRECIVVAREDVPGDKRLVGYVVAVAAVPDPTELVDFLAEQLPEYMVPSGFEFLRAFPLSPNGKIDRKALPAPAVPKGNIDYAAPATDAERRIAAIWSGILGVEEIGLRDTFFDLGGHSLLIMRLVRELSREFERSIELSSIFRFPTVEAQARYVTADDEEDAALASAAGAATRRRQASAQRLRRKARLARSEEANRE